MKLFKKTISSPQKRILSNLEKIAKISSLRISKDYTDSVIEDLNWIQSNFIGLLKLKEVDEEYFLSLLDPTKKYLRKSSIIEDFDVNEFDSFSLSFIEELPIEKEVNSLSRKYQTIHAPFNKEEGNDLVLRYIHTIFVIWNESLIKNNRLISKYCLFTFINWLAIIDQIEDEKIDYSSILKTFLDNLGIRNKSILDNDSEKLPDVTMFFTYIHYLERIFSPTIVRENIEIYFSSLFHLLYQVVETKKFLILEQFIAGCIDSNYYPSYKNNYSDLYSLISRKLHSINDADNIIEQLKPIAELGGYRINYIENLRELDLWNNELNEFLTKISEKQSIEFDILIEKQANLLKNHALNMYKFNRLQITVLKLLSFCLFKNNYSTIKHALEYNQPQDSSATFGNRDILPTTLGEILNSINFRYNIERELLGFWNGHHDVEPYLDKLFLILLYNYNPNLTYGNEDVFNSTLSYCKLKLLNDPGRIDGFKYIIKRLKTLFDSHSQNGILKEQFFTDEPRVNQTKILFDKIITSCTELMTKIEETTPIIEETKVNLLNSIIDVYHESNYFSQFFQLYGKVNNVSIPESNSIGINEMVDRKAFLENWHVPHIGIIENRGKILADQENRNAYFSLSKGMEKKTLNKRDIGSKLLEYVGQGYSVILLNTYIDMILRENKNFQSVYKNSSSSTNIDGFYRGKFKDIPIYELYDSFFDECMIFVKNENLTYNESVDRLGDKFIKIQDFKASFVDFGSDEISLQKMMGNPPLWLKDQFRNDETQMKNYLKKKVWIRIFKRSYFENTNHSESGLYQIED